MTVALNLSTQTNERTNLVVLAHPPYVGLPLLHRLPSLPNGRVELPLVVGAEADHLISNFEFYYFYYVGKLKYCYLVDLEPGVSVLHDVLDDAREGEGHPAVTKI